ncbi:hypothetical protein SAMN05421539_101286 [Jannaschia seohaensis]|uniref:Uncharacterized protein n=1 Tax=Jannaschia seohaensis TaxID=475081 RepID=A0A2Y9A1K8_9RHOB|nr:hypothetical protein BCF38_101286 [Jannaschia seohaensis]SSA38155.1 hypothetical protein SAMN05421539_101286 [Jannaschia seohaensis]
MISATGVFWRVRGWPAPERTRTAFTAWRGFSDKLCLDAPPVLAR